MRKKTRRAKNQRFRLRNTFNNPNAKTKTLLRVNKHVWIISQKINQAEKTETLLVQKSMNGISTRFHLSHFVFFQKYLRLPYKVYYISFSDSTVLPIDIIFCCEHRPSQHHICSHNFCLHVTWSFIKLFTAGFLHHKWLTKYFPTNSITGICQNSRTKHSLKQADR